MSEKSDIPGLDDHMNELNVSVIKKFLDDELTRPPEYLTKDQIEKAKDNLNTFQKKNPSMREGCKGAELAKYLADNLIGREGYDTSMMNTEGAITNVLKNVYNEKSDVYIDLLGKYQTILRNKTLSQSTIDYANKLDQAITDLHECDIDSCVKKMTNNCNLYRNFTDDCKDTNIQKKCMIEKANKDCIDRFGNLITNQEYGYTPDGLETICNPCGTKVVNKREIMFGGKKSRRRRSKKSHRKSSKKSHHKSSKKSHHKSSKKSHRKSRRTLKSRRGRR